MGIGLTRYGSKLRLRGRAVNARRGHALRQEAIDLGAEAAPSRRDAECLPGGREPRDALADAVSAESFDAARAAEGAAFRVASAERMRSATVKALEGLLRLLTPEQRRTLAYLIRTGSISF